MKQLRTWTWTGALLAVALVIAGCKSKKDEAQGETKPASPAVTPPPPKPVPRPNPNGRVLAKPGAIYPPGTRFYYQRRMITKNAAIHLSSPTGQVTGTTNSTQSLDLSVDVTSTTQVSVAVSKDREESTQVLQGKPVANKPRVGILEGRTVVFRFNNGQWIPLLGQNEGLATITIVQIVNSLLTRKSDLEVYGITPRGVGDSWETDPKHMTILTSGDTTGSVDMHFKGVEDHDGLSCAVLVAQLDLSSTNKSTGRTSKKGTMHVHRSLKHLADVSTTFVGKIEIEGAPRPGIRLETKGDFEMIQSLRFTNLE